jgi:hypothetical protein
MSDAGPLSYTRIEIESFLPSGWSLSAEAPEGRWDPRERAWRSTVRDGVGFEWPLVVPAAESRDTGRLEALRRAFDRLYRGRLGAPTRGLGLGRIA